VAGFSGIAQKYFHAAGGNAHIPASCLLFARILCQPSFSMNTSTPPEPSTADFSRTRRSLLTRLKNWDDRKGWQEFMDKYGRFIFGMARKQGFSIEEAEDVVQDVLVSVAKKMPEFRYLGEKGSFKAWLVMIVKSRVIDHLRKKYRRLPSAQFSGGEPDETRVEERVAQHEDVLSHESVWAGEWESHVLETALARVKERLPAKHFLAFRMCTQQQKSPGEVARALGISLPMIYVIRHRAGRMVAKEIEALREGR
jgi:RNA polymerase sigma-70 factor, ECF subfamily